MILTISKFVLGSFDFDSVNFSDVEFMFHGSDSDLVFRARKRFCKRVDFVVPSKNVEFINFDLITGVNVGLCPDDYEKFLDTFKDFKV